MYKRQVATLSSSLFNVVFDYIFMFPMGLGLAGAALATAVSPIISISTVSYTHLDVYKRQTSS